MIIMIEEWWASKGTLLRLAMSMADLVSKTLDHLFTCGDLIKPPNAARLGFGRACLEPNTPESVDQRVKKRVLNIHTERERERRC